MSSFKLSVVTPEKKIVTDLEIDEAIVPAYRGELDILPGHAPLITTLGVGTLRYRSKGSTEVKTAAISWGYCEVNPHGIVLLAETAETKEEVDKERAEFALKKAKEKLADPSLEPDQIQKFQRKLARAQARLDLAKNSH